MKISSNTPMQPESTPVSAKELDQSHRYLYQLVRDVMKENRRFRRQRRWSKILLLLLIGVILAIIVAGVFFADKMRPHIASIDLKEAITAKSNASAAHMIPALTQAFKNDAAKAIIIDINSPGGSPVESDRIFTAINRLQAEYPNKKVYAICNDICASGAYYIAAAADEIYANNASLVGSIGVIYSGFGVNEAMDKLGIESRRQTAGDNKAMLDMFSPANPEHQAMLQTMLDAIHQQFIDAVTEGRGDRLAADQTDVIFSGRFWHGGAGKTLGLVDELGTVDTVKADLDLPIVKYQTGSPIENLIGASVDHAVGTLLPAELSSSRDSGSGIHAILPMP